MRLTLCEAPTRETRPDHYTGNSVPYSLRQVRGFFNVPCWLYNTEDAGDGAYDLSSLSEKTRTSNHLQMSLQRQHVLLSYFKTLSVGPVWVESGTQTRDPSHSSPALYQLSLTGRRFSLKVANSSYELSWKNKTPGTRIEETYLLNNVEEILTLLRVTHQRQINKYLHCGVTHRDILVVGYVTQIWQHRWL